MIVAGWDVSPNHCAAVGIDAKTHEVAWVAVACEAKRTIAKLEEWSREQKIELAPCMLLPKLEGIGKHAKSVDRIYRLAPLFDSWCYGIACSAICIEDYAVGAAHGSHYIGEIGGLARLSMLRIKIGFRMIGVKSAKKVATGSGNATKPQMREAAIKAGFKLPDVDAQTQEDLCDAFAMAQCLAWEIKVKAQGIGECPKHVREVLLSKSKANPTPILSRGLHFATS